MAIAQISVELAGLLSVWLETLLYGIYASLFFETVFIMLKKKNRLPTGSSKIFFGATVVMFISITAHVAINLYRMLRGYVWLADSVGPAAYWENLSRWDTIAHGALNTFTTLVGDCLIIYRCYIVWDSNLPIVILPIVMVTMGLAANFVVLHQFAQLSLGSIFSPSLVHWMDTIYALAFAQNAMTTGLIVYRIWRQDRQSKVLLSSSFRLIVIVRIIVESASIYLLNILIVIIFYAFNSNGQYIAEEAIVPVCGIVFTLITVRLSLHTSTSHPTTQSPSTQLKFASTPGMTTDSGFTTTIDQSGFSNQAVSVDGNSFVSDDCGDVDGLEDNLSDFIDDTPLENVLRDEKVEMEHTLPGTAV
ncbi:hypothetical protein PILCRDRAFT_10620 [Piloderma croceum F 1598]|uniref:Uncharacterized protein n=1 Tax=Piloderma croceum (strain F 1598) TaxID=765440 RepID=A0A0C3FHZ3_PILCF|nr:hypothetical protein PILCRDRAFT_10620 [Piloderma croceum F 1598]